MSAAIAAFFLLFLPTASAIAATCEANITRRSRHPRKNQPATGADGSTPRNRSTHGGSNKSEDRWKPKPLPSPGRNRANTTATEPQDDTATNKDKTNKDQTTEKGGSATTEKKKSSSSELEEKTCQDMAIDAEEADTQTLKDTEKEKKEAKSGGRTGGPSPPGTGPAPSQTGTGGAWPVGMSGTRTGPINATKSSVFDVVDKKDDVPSEFELDSVKRLQKMSRESCAANNTQATIVASKEVVVEVTKDNHEPHPEKPPPPSPKKPPKKRDKKKEEEVRRWNAAIARGNVFRPRKDDETVDEVHADWGEPM